MRKINVIIKLIMLLSLLFIVRNSYKANKQINRMQTLSFIQAARMQKVLPMLLEQKNVNDLKLTIETQRADFWEEKACKWADKIDKLNKLKGDN